VAKLLTKKRRRIFGRTWGYVLLPIIAWGWFIAQIGPAPLAVLSALSFGFLLFQARVPCGAKIRDRDPVTGEHLFCRNNASGMLGGCPQFASHKWQNLKLLISRSTWGQFFRSLLRKASGQAAALGALASSASVVIALFALLVSIAKPGP
jgi:hypothetical protein